VASHAGRPTCGHRPPHRAGNLVVTTLYRNTVITHNRGSEHFARYPSFPQCLAIVCREGQHVALRRTNDDQLAVGTDTGRQSLANIDLPDRLAILDPAQRTLGARGVNGIADHRRGKGVVTRLGDTDRPRRADIRRRLDRLQRRHFGA